MAWKATFDEGIACCDRGDYVGALTHMNQAAELENNAFVIYDSRATIHEKLGNIKAALRDSGRVIDLAPDRWQGYSRSARLLDLRGRHGPVIKMVDHALRRLPPEDIQQHVQLLELKERAVAVQADIEKRQLSQIALSLYLLGKLPVEILLEIFSVLIDKDHTQAIKLSHVCGYWRQILINTPTVWQTLVLSKKHPLQKLEFWKQRAKNRISSISLDIQQPNELPIFTQLRDLSWDYLRTLHTSARTFLGLPRVLCDISIPHTFSTLDELSLFDCQPFHVLFSSSSGPQWELRILRLTGVIHMKDEWWERIQGLQELHLDGVLFPFSMAVFAANPSLEKLVVEGHYLGIASPANDSTLISVDNLKFVKFQMYNPFFIAHAITVPSIMYFSITGAAMMADETLLHIAARPSLVELHIFNCRLAPSTLMTLLSSTPNLETLQVSFMRGVGNQLLQFLSTEMTDPFHGLPCHALKYVDVSRCFDLTISSVYDFVKTRVQYAAKPPGSAEKCAIITALDLEGCSGIRADSDMVSWLRSNVARFNFVPAAKKNPKKNRRCVPEMH